MAVPNLDELEKMTNEQLEDVFGKMDLGVLYHLYSDTKDLSKRRDTPQGERTLQIRNKVLSARTEMSVDQYQQYFAETNKALDTRIANGSVQTKTVVIPKGTLLFRGISDMVDLVSAFAGLRVKSKSLPNYCLGIEHRVYFYPYPFVANLVSQYKHIILFVTTRDITLINLMHPDGYTYHNHGPALRDCQIPGCHRSQNSFEYCINYDLVPNTVTGVVGLHGQDTFNSIKNGFKYRPYLNKYYTTFVDGIDMVGVPEFILNPRQFPNVKELIKGDTIYPHPPDYDAIHGKGAWDRIMNRREQIDDFKTWYAANKSDLNYNYLHVMDNDFPKIQGLMDDFMSEGGLDLGDEQPYHLKMNKKNGLFQIVEFSNNHEDLIAPDFSIQTTDFIRKDRGPLPVPSGASRRPRTLRKRRLLKSR
jgi:hypothetical protein